MTTHELAAGLRTWLMNGDDTLPDPESVSPASDSASFEIVMNSQRFRISVSDPREATQLAP